MGEAFGVVASGLALAQAANQGWSCISQLYHAPAEFRRLQEQVQVLSNTIEEMGADLDISTHQALKTAILKGRAVVDELNELINSKLVRTQDKHGRISRKAWLKNKRNITRLRVSLDEAQKNLLGAVTAGTFCMTRRLSLATELASVQTAYRPPVATDEHHNFGGIRKLLGPSQCMQSELLPPGATEPMLRPLATRFDRCSVDFKVDQTNLRPECRKASSAGLECYSILSQPLPAPVTILEVSSLFRPTKYTSEDRRPSIIHHRNQELQASDHFQITQCAVYHFSTMGRWIRLTVTIETSRSSNYWSFVKSHTLDLGLSDHLGSAGGLNVKLKGFLASHGGLRQDCRLKVFLGDKESSEIQTEADTHIHKLARQSQGSANARHCLAQITQNVYHWGMPWCWDTEVDSYPVFALRKSDNLFFANLRSRWFLEFRFGSNFADVEHRLYNLKAMQALRGVAGVSQLTGVVIDRDTGIITSYLSELPFAGKLKQVIQQPESNGKALTMERKLKWCRQIVQAVAGVHRKELTVGTMGHDLNCIAIDQNDNALLHRGFRSNFRVNRAEKWTIPPEHHQLAETVDYITATYQTDIYQLGHLLWQIVENKSARKTCERPGCLPCIDPHTHVMEVPEINKTVPRYLRQVIAICRSEDPVERIPAWALLSMLPPLEEDIELGAQHEDGLSLAAQPHGTCPNPPPTVYVLSSQPSSTPYTPSNHHIIRLEECYEKFGPNTTCDICSNHTQNRYFHCNVCFEADFDLCPECFFSGEHCLDDSHILREVRDGTIWECYWSCEKGLKP